MVWLKLLLRVSGHHEGIFTHLNSQIHSVLGPQVSILCFRDFSTAQGPKWYKKQQTSHFYCPSDGHRALFWRTPGHTEAEMNLKIDPLIFLPMVHKNYVLFGCDTALNADPRVASWRLIIKIFLPYRERLE